MNLNIIFGERLMSAITFLIPVLSFITGTLIFIGKKFNINFVLNLKNYFIEFTPKSFHFISLVTLIITVVTRTYCLSLTNNSMVLNISLILIQTAILFHFTIIENLTSNPDNTEEEA